MLTMPLFLVLLLIAFVAVKYGATKLGPVVLGVLLGLTMASTAFGPPLTNGLEQFSRTLVATISQAAG
ncbi:MAG: hypothetical protein ACRCYU_13310 [Nocardioides sp.]